jgi:hypothetical protein
VRIVIEPKLGAPLAQMGRRLLVNKKRGVNGSLKDE